MCMHAHASPAASVHVLNSLQALPDCIDGLSSCVVGDQKSHGLAATKRCTKFKKHGVTAQLSKHTIAPQLQSLEDCDVTKLCCDM